MYAECMGAAEKGGRRRVGRPGLAVTSSLMLVIERVAYMK